MTYVKAKERCQSLGLSIVELWTDQQYQETKAWVNSNIWWVGLTDKAQEGTFVWESGHPLTIQKWRSGEPNDHAPGEDCAHVNHGLLNDVPCDKPNELYEVVCQKGNV